MVDLVNRDPNNINNFIQVQFDDVLAEPEGAHSADCIWKNSNKCFNCGLKFVYKLLTYLCGMCIALCWGCNYATFTFTTIWICSPFIRLLTITVYPIKKIMSIILSACCVPCIEAMGMIFSRIHVTNSTAPAPAPLGFMDGDVNQRK